MSRHCMDLCPFMHIWDMHTLMCRNADVITQQCSNLWPWTAQKCLGLKILFSGYLVCACQQPRIYLPISVVPCLCGSRENHKECGTDTNRDGPGHCQDPRKAGEPAAGRTSHWLTQENHTGKSGTPMVFICCRRQKQSVRINRNGLVSKMENWITGCQEVAGHGDGCNCHCKDLISPCWKMTGLFRRNGQFSRKPVSVCSNLSNPGREMLLLLSGWCLGFVHFNLCQISSEHRFGYEITSFSFLCLSATGCYMKWSLSSFLTSLLWMFEHFQLLQGQGFHW